MLWYFTSVIRFVHPLSLCMHFYSLHIPTFMHIIITIWFITIFFSLSISIRIGAGIKLVRLSLISSKTDPPLPHYMRQWLCENIDRHPSQQNRQIYAISSWPQKLCSDVPARLDPLPLVSDSSAHSFFLRFLPMLSRLCAVALTFARCGQLTGGLSPPRSRPCWAHTPSPA